MNRNDELKDFERRGRILDTDNDEAFRSFIREARVVLEKTDGDIADILMVSRTTFNRWINGKSMPHPLMRPSVVSRILDRVGAKLSARSTYAYSGGGGGMVAKSYGS